VTLVAFALASGLGLFIALARTSHFRVLREVSTFYVEIVRGIPMLVALFSWPLSAPRPSSMR
jgi:polar amino acid transport system permease protein